MKRMVTRFWIFTAVIISAVFIMARMDAHGNTMTVADEFKYVTALEDNYKTDLKQRLDNMGYPNAGITVNSITEASGSKSYTVLIHHNRIELLEDQQRLELMKDIEDMNIWGEECDVEFEFI